MFAAFNALLVALDGRRGGLDAAALAGLLAGPDAKLAIAHVMTTPPDAVHRDQITEARRLLGADPPVFTVRTRSVAAGLLELVHARGADLLVLGAHHHRHVNLRSHDHTRDALRQMPCAVAVAPWGYSTRPVGTI